MKIFQIFGGFCHWDATAQYPTLADTVGKFAPDILFVEAPDYVHEGWGYDPTQEGNARFIEPIPPEGWLYDRDTGTFYQEGTPKPERPKTAEERLQELELAIGMIAAELVVMGGQ